MSKLSQIFDTRPKIIVAGILVLLLIFFKMVVQLDDYTIVDEKTGEVNTTVNWIISTLLFITYFLIITCLVGSFVLFVYRISQNVPALIRFAILIGVVIIVFGICYIMSPSDLTTVSSKLAFTESSLKLTGGLVNFTATLIIGGFLIAIGSEIYKVVK